MITGREIGRLFMTLVVAATVVAMSCLQVPKSDQNRMVPAEVAREHMGPLSADGSARTAPQPPTRTEASAQKRVSGTIPGNGEAQGMDTLAAEHQPSGIAPVTIDPDRGQTVIVIPDNWKELYPSSERFPHLESASGANTRHVIDLAAMRFETDGLVSVSPNGQRKYSAPNLSSFPRILDTPPFRTASEDYFIVQAKTAGDQASLRAWLEANGIPILDFLPQLAYLVRVSEGQLSSIERRPEVFWVGHYSPAFRVDSLLDFIIESNPSQQVRLRLLFDVAAHKELQPLLDELRGIGLSDLKKHARRSRDWSIRVEGPAIRARDAALLPGCLWVERYVEPHLANNTARTSQNIVTGRGAANGPVMDVEDVWARGIRGEGQIASASDTGLSTGNLATLHQDFGQSGSGTNPLRVLAGYALGRAGNWDDNQSTGGGHGTHTSGSIVGNGFRSGSTPSTNTFPTSSYAGTAPKAQFVFQSIMDSGGGLGGLPADLNTLFQQAYDDGARVHSNSWGADTNGLYNTDSQEVDQFAWRNKDMVITFSAGNSGDDTSSPGPIDGIINRDSMGSPATAKNCITVGASESYVPAFVYEFPSGDCTSSNGIEQRTWGWFNSSTFSTNPVFSDLIADNANGLAPFSSRGPTDDGRFKPDVVAPGTAIISTRTDVNQAYEQWGTCSVPVAFRPYYFSQGGTSMANPLTAGAATLVRQYYADGWHANNTAVTNGSPIGAQGFNPSSALVKATLINGAWDMNPGQYGTGATREIVPNWDTGMTLPNNAEGYGRVDVEKSLFPGSGWLDSPNRKLQIHDVTSGLTTGGNSNFTFIAGGNGNPLIVTLVWTDPQAATGAGTKLVNDLDLTVTSPGGVTTYYPNGVDKTTGSDTLNNVEQVKVTNPIAGTWAIKVAGTNIPGNAEPGSTTQPFALVISGEGCTTAPSVPTGVTATSSAPNRITVHWTASTGSPVTYNVYRAGPGSACPLSGYSLLATVAAPTVTFDDVTASGGSTYSYRVTASGASCESAASSCSSATPAGVCTLPPAFAGLASVTAPGNASCGLSLAWAGASASCSGAVTYNVYRSTSSEFAPNPANRIAMRVATTSYSDVQVSLGTTYYYVVRAVQNGIEETNAVRQSGSPTGQITVVYTQNFDSLPAGDMAGFTTSGAGAVDWRGVMACSPNQSAGNVFRFGGNGCALSYSDNADTQAVINGSTGLAIPVAAFNTRLNFWHRWDFELFFDGGALRIQRQGDGAFTNVPSSAIVTGTYNNTTFGGANVWGGTVNTTMTNSVVDLDAACNAIPGNAGGCAGKTIFIAFTAVADVSVTRVGWYIDDVKVTYETACATCTPPGAPTGLALTALAGNTVHLTWAAGAPAGISYNIYRESGTCPVSAPALIASGITATTYDDSGLTGGSAYRYVVRAVSASGCESGNSGCQSATAAGPALPAPPNLVASGASTSSVSITWGSVAGASSYLVERSLDNANFSSIGITTGSSMTDTGLALNTAYMYRAFAQDGNGGTSSASRDLGTTVVFAEDPLIAGSTIVQAVHLTQLRTAVNAVRTLAALPAGSYTDPTITPGATILRRHVTELRTNLDTARSILGLAALSYTDPAITAGTTKVKAAHIQELRNGTK